MRVKFSTIAVIFFLFVLVTAVMADSEAQINVNNSAIMQSVQKIAFSSKRNGNFDIYTINDNGSDLKRLTTGKNDDLKPQWSPDGNKILFLSKEGRKKYSLRVMNSDGSGQVRIFNDCSDEYPPAWSPDGTKILFTIKSKGKNGIFTIDVNGGTPIRLTEMKTDNAYPSWSPDGSKVIFRQRKRDYYDIYTINPDGTEKFNLTKEPARYMSLAWSPDGSKVGYIGISRKYFTRNNAVHVINFDGANDIEICDGSKKTEDIDYLDQLNWAPDGNTVAFNKVAEYTAYETEKGSVTFEYTYGIYIVNSKGNQQEELLDKTGKERVLPGWAPDSSKLAFVNNSKLKIFNMKSKLADEIQVGVTLPLSPVSWSPDGKKVLFAGKGNSFQKAGLYLVTLDGNVTKLSQENDYDPVWAPATQ